MAFLMNLKLIWHISIAPCHTGTASMKHWNFHMTLNFEEPKVGIHRLLLELVFPSHPATLSIYSATLSAYKA